MSEKIRAVAFFDPRILASDIARAIEERRHLFRALMRCLNERIARLSSYALEEKADE